MKSVCLVNGSLRGAKSSSLVFLRSIMSRMNSADVSKELITVRTGAQQDYREETLVRLSSADALVIAFPLFVYSLPGGLTRLLEELHSYRTHGVSRNRDAKVFAIVNCGFPEPRIMSDAIRVMRNFCARSGLTWRFAVAIASGPVTVMTVKVPFLNLRLKRAFAEIAEEAQGGEPRRTSDVYVAPVIPKPIILRIKEQYEKKFDAGQKPAPSRT